MKKLSILGVTGSIGTQALDVIKKSNGELKLIGATANSSVNKMIEIIEEFNPKYVGMMDKNSADKLEKYCKERNKQTIVLSQMEGLNKIASLEEIDIVLTSLVGMIGLEPTLEAIKAKKDIALANKETLVVAGELVMSEAKKNNVKILPVDSEHSAIYQSLRGNDLKTLNKIILTASGGPFRGKKLCDLNDIGVDDALNHPKWNMGRKISIDSATLMNKGLEVIEAHWLFNCDYDNIQVVIHPQSVVHSMVEYCDGSIIAQLGAADMRLPIQYAFNYTERKNLIAKTLDFYEVAQLTFEKPDLETFKPLKLAFKAGKQGGLMPTILNGANEAAVALFLDEKIEFLDIFNIIENCMNTFEEETKKPLTLENIIELDKKVKKYVVDMK
ncbi:MULTISPECIES: 1-deoxy-D-xylulose-5-phosphate reductoisomerase [Clostridium]|uniref:1-deoxy-D-xylulose 5-phosphate reductoisomerase n=1 Tax=Clostridium botulinum (strain Eklund 17B / Type B) TaxID=935198 RepID=DXR_CLOBB|nr:MULTISPECIES: 1-deoxy-D-xylulose-5-phosphate reductoisomerase [Clostridium]B2TJ47.1 RecName: Full=1-deoxy-D-xylulose 5-phosphate reductoisomerase; Short=DXP reductoisomerase; AltName: Full=1-deoxyxylulose-5-phosphate reductoisomerase; AltName: Full=2-C-methyl-D-erythritol 4-phosphate synthase [Clostridium botulinum B str. Eklund 17B (NRP)]MBN1044931.1 1-deoxy-D-xylulose-5-phosphate reductoisomerase [Clostridium botulinum]ACD22759.1 1-deoxy-D-xylulose 5-phosphate reductoisomerase [Clostridium 